MKHHDHPKCAYQHALLTTIYNILPEDYNQLSGLIRPYSHCAFLAALNHFWACSLSAYTGKLQLEIRSQSVSLRASVQTPLPERPQLLPHRPRPAADVGHDLLLVLDVLEDLLGVMVVSLILADILI